MSIEEIYHVLAMGVVAGSGSGIVGLIMLNDPKIRPTKEKEKKAERFYTSLVLYSILVGVATIASKVIFHI
jgi:hypothetical protein